MELVVEILKKTRENKKISLFDASQELKISIEILSDIENNCFVKDINKVFLIGLYLYPPPD